MLSLIIPTWPLNAGSQRSLTLVISRSVSFGLYAIPVKPDCHATVYLFPGSKSGFFTSGLAYLTKFGSCAWSSGISHSG